ncbi:MAG: hypothetical protein A3G34_05295 [Candidatus Lindowbacteria bacterium RIFCSPLOWO2_12_FULL_62_27]|nr:MAG: hypothetical protein A3I06_12945 [Candidatus Lindowbacteria bacterium RIFCSPLOWO2_02_FULL_62_12]OGH61400.1 MAG: hypothetical protein A3G34_05295 [Candidatus Lindowbacteria bacterium RIFCSPLOWO2_12_FULL_62_27]
MPTDVARRAVLVVTHGGVGGELVAVARELLGDIPHLAAVSVTARDSMEEVSAKIEKWALKIPAGARAVILTDLKNSSATVSALTLSKKYPLDCLCGVNLPLLLKALSPSDAGLPDLVAAGRTGIDVVGKSK